jgi:(1->4)-alpha-D-glucan 1-alpha-D-glucosylmutase
MQRRPVADVPVASYRLQLTPTFGFAEAVAVFDHLVALGVSHVYLSPIAEAVPGSAHGYDVVDHTRARAELGGDDGLATLFDAAAERGLLVLFDHVPNHTATTRPELNPRWWAYLRDGPTSPSAAWFDVDLTVGDGKVIVPVLAAPLADVIAEGGLEVDEDRLVLYGQRQLPLAAGTPGLPLDELVELQHYVLTQWRSPQRNVRRFFTIDDLVGVRVEDPTVAATVDTLPSRWATHPAFGGVRVDHVDGLADPLGYLRGLRARIGDRAMLVVEKILAPGETLPPSWPVDGTTGYEYIRAVDHLLLDPSSAVALDASWREVADDERTYPEIEETSRREVIDGALRPDVLRASAAMVAAIDDVPPGWVESAVRELTARLPRYRTYLPDDDAGRAVLIETADHARQAVEDPTTLDRVVSVLLAEHGAGGSAAHIARTRWQQLTGPAMAKGVEDRAFYRYLRLASVCEVGGDAGHLGIEPDDVHADLLHEQQTGRTSMLAGSTHDTKRSDDVRARSSALTWWASQWTADVATWSGALRVRVPIVDGAAISHALQTVVTCPGLDVGRLATYLVKAAREAGAHTSWTDPDDGYERALGGLAGEVLGLGDVANGLDRWARRLDAPGRRATVVATALRCTFPGFPDLFQGTEVPAFRLVDPDNRRAPDWDALRHAVERAGDVDLAAALAGAEPDVAKTVVLVRLLALRRRRTLAFGRTGAYSALTAGASMLAFSRADEVVTVAAIRSDLDPDAVVHVPAGSWRDVLSDSAALHCCSNAEVGIRAVEILGRAPVAVLERVN